MALTRRCLLLAAAASIARPAVARAQVQPIAIGMVPANALYWDIDVAAEKGFFQAGGFEPQISAVQSSPQAVQQAVLGAYQLAVAQPEVFIAGVEHGAAMLGAIAAPMNRADWRLSVLPEIRTFTDLRGRIIGVSTPRSGEVWLTRQLLERAGLRQGEFDFQVVGVSPQKLAALQKGAIAATVMYEPSAELAAKEGFPSLAHYSDLRAFQPVLYMVNRDWAAKQDNGKRLAQAIRRAHEWLWNPDNRAEAIAILMKATKRERPIIEAVYDEYFVTRKIYSRDGEIDPAGIDTVLADMAEDGGQIGSPPPPASKFLLDRELGGLWSGGP